MEVQLEIAEENLKVFVAALQCLAQVGKELSLECEASSPRLTLRALNDAHSASGQVTFDRSFFTSTVAGASGASLAGVPVTSTVELREAFGGRTPFVKCKVFAKSCCNVFRTLKHVRSVQLTLLVDAETVAAAANGSIPDDPASQNDDEVDLDALKIRWRLRCDFDITKTHQMKVQSCQVMRAVFDKDNSANRWRTRQHHLASLLAHIHHTNEVSVTCSATHVKFESYFPNSADGKAQLQTETAVESVEFSEYELQPATDGLDSAVQLIFCLKEIRALLAFCKTSDVLEVAFYFSSAGSPVLFAAESTSMAQFSVEITLSTVTTFLPASSQARSEEEAPLYAAQNSGEEPRESDSSQDNVRYLTHSKRPRVN